MFAAAASNEVTKKAMMITSRRRRSSTHPSEWWVTVKGKASLCFTKDGSCFEGTLVTEGHDFFGLQGQETTSQSGDTDSDIPSNDSTCGSISSETDDSENKSRLMFEVDIIDLDDRSKRTLKGIAMSNLNSACSFESDAFHFTTEQHIVGEGAERFIKKHLSHKFMGNECYVCVGPMEITYKQTAEEELCRSPPHYIF